MGDLHEKVFKVSMLPCFKAAFMGSKRLSLNLDTLSFHKESRHISRVVNMLEEGAAVAVATRTAWTTREQRMAKGPNNLSMRIEFYINGSWYATFTKKMVRKLNLRPHRPCSYHKFGTENSLCLPSKAVKIDAILQSLTTTPRWTHEFLVLPLQPRVQYP